MKKKPTALVTSGPTLEKIDPVRYISNFSSGKQGYAIAKALHQAGFEVTLVSGPVSIPAPKGVKVINVESAEEMLEACMNAMPVDVAVCAAAVCDFRPAEFKAHKIKKQENVTETSINLIQNTDILKTISTHKQRPKVVVGFAAETDSLLKNAIAKLDTKNCDIIVANDVTGGHIFGNDITSVSIVTHQQIEQHNNTSKDKVAQELADIISNILENKNI